MTQVHEVMSREVVHIAPDTTIRHAAELMRDHDIGALPVCDGDQIVGMVTDRDLAMRGLAQGCTGEETVSHVATSGVQWCYEDEDVNVVQRRMAEAQVRRLPVVNHERELVGTLSLGDIATRCDGAQRERIANTLEDISQRRVP
ncbi:CBS domain-containing protein [Paraburkholderia sp. CNPSo 3076]|uniref:CBS domain-containing protein n=1 Tax=Paraburkholderia sp. CNPSo 3076 TaxID=2940936 RepID=UPI0022552D42|nr:CBS domain-containing protein [Paraburkholderia sp. CNPSo 3076]MCX5543394.1 CBS domain-containing protein [Paraburkholderia sp. CNPSo 3076]